MIYHRQFIKETTFTAIAIFFVVLAILVFTQGINMLGRAADGRVAVDAVATLIGFWTLGMTPLLLVLTAYISTLTVLTRYWRDSEMAIWLSSGLGLRKWIRPVLTFCPAAGVAGGGDASCRVAVGGIPQPRIRRNLEAKAKFIAGASGHVSELGKKTGACILWKR